MYPSLFSFHSISLNMFSISNIWIGFSNLCIRLDKGQIIHYITPLKVQFWFHKLKGWEHNRLMLNFRPFYFVAPNCFNVCMGPEVQSKNIAQNFYPLMSTKQREREGNSRWLHICHAWQEFPVWMMSKSQEKNPWTVLFEWTEGPTQKLKQFRAKKLKQPKIRCKSVTLSALQTDT